MVNPSAAEVAQGELWPPWSLFYEKRQLKVVENPLSCRRSGEAYGTGSIRWNGSGLFS